MSLLVGSDVRGVIHAARGHRDWTSICMAPAVMLAVLADVHSQREGEKVCVRCLDVHRANLRRASRDEGQMVSG